MFRIRENEIADALTTSDIWKIMLKEVPPIAAEYFVGGADELTTLKANVLAFKQVLIAPRGAIKNKYIDTTSKIFGEKLSLPFFHIRLSLAVLAYLISKHTWMPPRHFQDLSYSFIH